AGCEQRSPVDALVAEAFRRIARAVHEVEVVLPGLPGADLDPPVNGRDHSPAERPLEIAAPHLLVQNARAGAAWKLAIERVLDGDRRIRSEARDRRGQRGTDDLEGDRYSGRRCEHRHGPLSHPATWLTDGARQTRPRR